MGLTVAGRQLSPRPSDEALRTRRPAAQGSPSIGRSRSPPHIPGCRAWKSRAAVLPCRAFCCHAKITVRAVRCAMAQAAALTVIFPGKTRQLSGGGTSPVA